MFYTSNVLTKRSILVIFLTFLTNCIYSSNSKVHLIRNTISQNLIKSNSNNSSINHTNENEASTNRVTISNNTSIRLTLSVFYETLCPYSISFFEHQLGPAWKLFGEEYLEIKFIPYGNSHTYFQPGFISTSCQHGESECYSNKIHACALEYMPPSISRDFIFCTMTSAYPPPHSLTNCSLLIDPKYEFEEKVVNGCGGGRAGELAVALKGLMSIDFITEGVPSIAVDGKVAEGEFPFGNLVQYLCIIWRERGVEKIPDGCKGEKMTEISLLYAEFYSRNESNSKNEKVLRQKSTLKSLT